MTLLDDPSLIRVYAGIFAVLAAATGVETVARSYVVDNRGRALLLEVDARIRSWWVILLVYMASVLAGRPGLVVLFGCLSFMALREFITLVPTRRADHVSMWCCFFVAAPLQYGLIATNRLEPMLVAMPLFATIALPLATALAGDTCRCSSRTAQLGWGLLLCVYCLSHAPALFMLDISGGGHNGRLLLYLILVVESSDVLQYLWGKALGRYAIAPRVSPSKTVEGLVGGVVCASGLGAALWWLTPFTPAGAAIFAFVLTLAGFAGGLIMSAVKRDYGVKDFGAMIPGHGGVLDRVDSLIVAAPVCFHLTRLLATS